MPPRLNFASLGRSLAIRARPLVVPYQLRVTQVAARRHFADDSKPQTDPTVIGHVSEEAAETNEIMGETVPDLGQGTPVQEILERDGDMDKAPEVIKEESEAEEKSAKIEQTIQNLLALKQMHNIVSGGHGTDPVAEGHIYDLPTLPLPPTSNLKHRYDPVIEQVTNLMMQHGKKSAAQRNMAFVLNHLRTASPPTPSPAHALLPGAPPATHLPLNPIAYLTLAIDSVAPLIRIRSQKGAAGGGAALQIPVPLGIRQRRRQAVTWILDAVSKKNSRGSGRGMFAQRFAEELIGIVEGRSGAWDKRLQIHKIGTSARANMNSRGMSRR